MSSSDKKLLILAAKAAGIELSYGKVPYTSFDGLAKGWKDWNPLTNDGDALRLAVKLEMNVDVGIYGVEAAIIDDDQRISAEEALRQDPYAATRRAIVRAAAEIGKARGE